MPLKGAASRQCSSNNEDDGPPSAAGRGTAQSETVGATAGEVSGGGDGDEFFIRQHCGFC
jgi:hypothetical protein